MKKYQRSLLLFTLIVIAVMSFGAGAAAAEKTDASTVKTEPLKKIFSDVASSDNNALFINYLADRKIISGYPDGSFKAKEGLSRAQAAVILVKAAGLEAPAADKSSFNDVAVDHWAAANIAAAVKAGYIKGYPDGSYHPDEKLTRAQGIALVMRLSKQKERDQLPQLKDMEKTHWAAADMATALNASMIGLSEDKTSVYPEAEMSRGSLARALGTLLTKDPGLYTRTLGGTIKDVKGEIKLTRNGSTSSLQNNTAVYKGDSISTRQGSANLVYPDGSSVLIKENSELTIKESTGRACIKKDGTAGVAVDNVDIELSKGTIFGALATKQDTVQEKQQAGETLLASMDGLGYLAEAAKTPPWYQQAEAKKVKMKVDMPYGVAAIRGTYILVTVNQDGSCNVACLTGDAEVGSKSGATAALPSGQSSAVSQSGNVAPPTPMAEQEKQQFSAVQQWVVNTALQIDQNKEAKAPPVIEMVVEMPDQPANPAGQVKNTIDVVINALEASGIQLTEEVKNELKEQMEQLQQELDQQTQQVLETPSLPSSTQTSSGGGSTEESTVNYISYATAGTYGPESAANAQTVAKNVIISAPGVTLRNMIIGKDLTLAAGIGSGSVTLENVRVQGNTYVYGGGANSIILQNCELYTVTVDKNEVRIVARGSSSIGALTLNSAATLQEDLNAGASGFSSISTGLALPAGAVIVLSGNFAAVNINAPDLSVQLSGGSIEQMSIASTAGGTDLNLASGASVNTLEVNARANIGGAGAIATASINASNVVMAQTPTTLTVSSGVNANVGGQPVSGGSTQIVSSIVIEGDQSISIPASGSATRNYTATVKDQNGVSMTGESVSWSLLTAPSGVSIDSSGMLTVNAGTTAGTCTIVATSTSNPSKNAELQVSLNPCQPTIYGLISNPVDGATLIALTSITGTADGGSQQVGGGGVFIKNIFLNKWVNPVWANGDITGKTYVDERCDDCIIGPFSSTSGNYATWELNLSGLELESGTYTIYLRVGLEELGPQDDQDNVTVTIIESWNIIGDSGFSGPLLEGSDIGLVVDDQGQIFVGYTENGEVEGPVKVAINEEGSWFVSTVDSDSNYPGKGPLDIDLLNNNPLLAWWDGNEPLQLNAMAVRLGEESEGWQWNSYPSGIAEIDGDGVNALSIASVNGVPLVGYQEGSDINVMQAFYYQGDGWCWEGIGNSFQGSNPQVKVGDYHGNPVIYLAWQGDGEQTGTVMKGRYDELEQCWMWTQMPDLTYSLQEFSLDTANENVYLAVEDENGKPVVITCAPFASPDNPQWLRLGGTLDNPLPVSDSMSENLSLYVEGNGTPYLAFKDMSQEGKATLMKAVYLGSSDGNPCYAWVPLGLPGLTPGIADDLQLYVQGGTVYLAFKDGSQEGEVTVMSYEDPLAAVDFNFRSRDYDDVEPDWELSGLDDSMEYSLDGGGTYLQMPAGNSELYGCLGGEPAISATDNILLRLAAQPEQVLCIDLLPGLGVPEAEVNLADNIIEGLDAGQLYEIDWDGDGDADELYPASPDGEICLDDYDVDLEPGIAFSIRKPAWGKRFPSEWQEVLVPFWIDIGMGLGEAGNGGIALASSAVAYIDSDSKPHVKWPPQDEEQTEWTESPTDSDWPDCNRVDLVDGGLGTNYKLFFAFTDDTNCLIFMQYYYYQGDMGFWRWDSLDSPLAPSEETGLFKMTTVSMEGMQMPLVAYEHTVGDAVYGTCSQQWMVNSELVWNSFDFYSGSNSLQAMDIVTIGSDCYIAYVDPDGNLIVTINGDALSDPFSIPGGFIADCGLSMVDYNGNPAIAYADSSNIVHVIIWNGSDWIDESPSDPADSDEPLQVGESPIRLCYLPGGQEYLPQLMLVYTAGTENRISIRFYDGGEWTGEGATQFNDISDPVATGAGTLSVNTGDYNLPVILFKGQDGILHMIAPNFVLNVLDEPLP